MPKWPIYQASGYGEVFMYDHNERLRWFPNYETLKAYGYTGQEKVIVPISWFYDKPIVESIQDVKTGECYPPEKTPNYEDYRGGVNIKKLRELVDELDKIVGKADAKIDEIDQIVGRIKKLIEEWE